MRDDVTFYKDTRPPHLCMAVFNESPRAITLQPIEHRRDQFMWIPLQGWYRDAFYEEVSVESAAIAHPELLEFLRRPDPSRLCVRMY